MAEEDLSLEEPVETPEEGEPSGSKKKLIIIAGAAALLLIVGGVAAYFLLSGDSADSGAPVTEVTADGTTVEVASKPVEAVVAPPKGDAIYINIPEPFLVNIMSGKKTRMMEIKMQFMVRSKAAEEAIDKHMPLIRNNMLDFLSQADAAEVTTREGRNALKEGALLSAQKVIKEQAGFEAIEMVLFTGFVVQ